MTMMPKPLAVLLNKMPNIEGDGLLLTVLVAGFLSTSNFRTYCYFIRRCGRRECLERSNESQHKDHYRTFFITKRSGDQAAATEDAYGECTAGLQVIRQLGNVFWSTLYFF